MPESRARCIPRRVRARDEEQARRRRATRRMMRVWVDRVEGRRMMMGGSEEEER
jgi:hypothetical protein